MFEKVASTHYEHGYVSTVQSSNVPDYIKTAAFTAFQAFSNVRGVSTEKTAAEGMSVLPMSDTFTASQIRPSATSAGMPFNEAAAAERNLQANRALLGELVADANMQTMATQEGPSPAGMKSPRILPPNELRANALFKLENGLDLTPVERMSLGSNPATQLQVRSPAGMMSGNLADVAESSLRGGAANIPPTRAATPLASVSNPLGLGMASSGNPLSSSVGFNFPSQMPSSTAASALAESVSPAAVEEVAQLGKLDKLKGLARNPKAQAAAAVAALLGGGAYMGGAFDSPEPKPQGMSNKDMAALAALGLLGAGGTAYAMS